MNRAFSVLAVKAVDEDARVIEGIASTPEADRMGDIVEPMGAKFKLPLPLLWQHAHDKPVGHVEFAKPTKQGIPFKARIVDVQEPGALKDRVDEAWQSVKAGLINAVSIGFSPLKYAFLKEGGVHFEEWEWLELSLVTIPANSGAIIQNVKSISHQQLAALGRDDDEVRPVPPGASGKPVKAIIPTRPKEGKLMKKTFAEQISAFEATRAAKAARMSEIMEKAADEGVTLDAEQTEEYDTLETEVKQIDEHLRRLTALQKANAASAKPVDEEKAEKSSTRHTVFATAKKELPKGTAFTRFAMALAAGRGSISDAEKYLEGRPRWQEETPEVMARVKAVAGSTVDGNWANPLFNENNLTGEFIELLRPATILGRIAGVRNVPFNVRIPVQTGGSTVNWVGEAAPKPVTELEFDAITMGHNKIAGIVVLTDELVRFSTPSAEDTVRRDLVEQVARFMDEQFITPSVAGGANNPASVTNGVTAITASGTDAEAFYYDLNQALSTFDDTDLGTNSITLVMRPGTARGISTLRNALGQFEFGGFNMAGGNLAGFNVVVSNSAPSGSIVIIKGDEILLADDGQVSLDASREATLDMNGGTTPSFNLWQRNCVGIRAERFITWRKRRADAVAMIGTAAYGPAAPAG